MLSSPILQKNGVKIDHPSHKMFNRINFWLEWWKGGIKSYFISPGGKSEYKFHFTDFTPKVENHPSNSLKWRTKPEINFEKVKFVIQKE